MKRSQPIRRKTPIKRKRPKKAPGRNYTKEWVGGLAKLRESKEADKKALFRSKYDRPRTAQIDFTHDPSRAQPKQLPGRSQAFLAFVRKHPCSNCGWSAGPCEASHHGAHGTGTKASDLDAIGLCPSSMGYEGCHAYYHRTGRLPVRACDGRIWQRGKLEQRAVIAEAQSKLKTEWIERGCS